MPKTNIQIAGSKTAADWHAFRSSLKVGSDPAQWQQAYDEYFCARLNLRYLDPISVLQQHGSFQGEGFSIVAIQCTLVEFLEATLQGKSYRYLRRGDVLGPYEYSSSSDIFVNFLCTRRPFDIDFDEPVARDFYVSVRCGLLHEARTKNDWPIWAKSPTKRVIDRVNRIVYRDTFQVALEEFITSYGSSLQSDAALQEAFIRKFDSLCI